MVSFLVSSTWSCPPSKGLQKYTVNNYPPRIYSLGKNVNTGKNHLLQLSLELAWKFPCKKLKVPCKNGVSPQMCLSSATFCFSIGASTMLENYGGWWCQQFGFSIAILSRNKEKFFAKWGPLQHFLFSKIATILKKSFCGGQRDLPLENIFCNFSSKFRILKIFVVVAIYELNIFHFTPLPFWVKAKDILRFNPGEKQISAKYSM